jgi:enoyl-CoA hydratase/carnithine racemase
MWRNAMAYETILVDRKNHVGVLTLNRADKLNALSVKLFDEIVLGLEDLERDEEVHAVVVRANGRAFCAGRDVSDPTESPLERHQHRRFARLAAAIAGMGKPVIAAVQGPATAGGFGLALACDLVIAAADARFGMTAINVGLFGFGPALVLSRSLGQKKALEILLTGDLIGAPEAERLGLVNRVVSRERLDEAAMELAEKLAKKSPVAVQMGKRGFYTLADMEYLKALDYSEALISILHSTEDVEEGIKAFLEKRDPVWKKR